MIPILFPADQTGFRENNGLGGLPDAINCIVTEQRNTPGGYWLEMDYPVDGLHFDLLAPERIIHAAPAMGQRPQPFRISRIARPINGIVHIEAPHISVELQKLTTYGMRIGTDVGAMGRGFFAKAREIGQSTHFDFASNITVSPQITISHPEPVPMIDVLLGAEGSFLDLVGGEYEFDEFDVVLHAQRGVDSGLEIRHGVNMSDLEAETDATELVTACIPFWKGTVNEQDVVVIGDMCSASNASAYSYVRCVPLDVSEQFDLEQDQQPTQAQVTAKGQAFINSTSRKLLQTSIRVSYEPTTSGIGERRINLCDTVRVVYPDLNVSSISKVVETKYNVLTERYDELTIGTIRNNIVDTIAGMISGGASYSVGGYGGGGDIAVGAVLYNMPQRLNEAQKAQARSNIGVTASGSGLPEPTDADNGKVLGIRNGQYTLVDDQTGDDTTFPEDTEIDLSKVAWEIGAFTANGKNYDAGGASTVSAFATSSYTTTQSGRIRIVLASSSTIPSGYVPNVTITKPGGGTYDLSGVVWEYGSIGTSGQNLNGVTNRIRTKDSIDVEAGAVVSCGAFSTYNEGMRVAELNMSLYRRVRTIGFIKAPARTVISCSDFSLCEKGLRVCEYAAPDLSLTADVVSAIAPRNYRVTKSCYIRILLASDTIRYDLPLNTGSHYDGQMMTSVASEIVHAMIPAQTVRPSNAYTRRTGIPRIILPWSGYELLTTTTADAELPSTNKLSTIYGKWDALMAQYPGYIEKETVGYGEKPNGDSNEYPIYAYTLRSYIPTPDNPNRNPNSQFKFTYDKPQKNLEVIWIGTIHAHEHTVPVDDFKFFSELMKRETEVTDLLMLNCDFTVIPIMNPYGYEHFNEILNDVPNAGVRCGRVNANGVNLNRNFPEQWQYIEPFVEGEPNNDYAGAEAASESEVQAVMAFLTAHSDAFICVNRHTSSEFAPTSILAYFASIIEEDTKIAFNACRFMDAQMHHSDLYANYIGTVKALDFDKMQDTNSRCLYTVQKSETPGTMDKWYNAVLGLDGFLFEMSPNDHNYANSPWGREVWQRINVTGIGNMLYSVMLQNEYIPKG